MEKYIVDRDQRETQAKHNLRENYYYPAPRLNSSPLVLPLTESRPFLTIYSYTHFPLFILYLRDHPPTHSSSLNYILVICISYIYILSLSYHLHRNSLLYKTFFFLRRKLSFFFFSELKTSLPCIFNFFYS